MILRLSLFSLFFLVSLAQAQFTDQAQIPDWAETSIEKLNEAEVIAGNDDGSLKPYAKINRAEFAKILIEATGTDLIKFQNSQFNDIDPSAWHSDYIHTAKQKGWLDGYPDGSFRPGNDINRAEIGKLIIEAFEIPQSPNTNDQYWFDKYIRGLSDNQLLPYKITLAEFTPDYNPSRAEVFEQLYRAMQREGQFSSFEVEDPNYVSNREQQRINALPIGQTKLEPETEDENFLVYTPETPSAESVSNALLNLKVISQTNQIVLPGDINKTLLSLNLAPEEGSMNIKGIQIRRIGKGQYTDFSELWVELNGQVISPKVTPVSDLVYIQFKLPKTISTSSTLLVKGNLAKNAQSETSSRWVLYLPEWINTNTKRKVGFFPLSGGDIEIK